MIFKTFDHFKMVETILEIPPVEHTNTYEMPKFSPQVVKDNLIDMSSVDPLLPPYLPVVDELSRFIVEDSPCNFSLMSNLSALTIESSTHQEANIKK